MIGKGVIKDCAVNMCLNLVEEQYDYGESTDSASKNFYSSFDKPAKTSGGRVTLSKEEMDDLRIKRAGKKMLDLYVISKARESSSETATGKNVENQKAPDMPSAGLEVAKGIFKILGMLAVVAFCVSWLAALPLALAAVGLTGVAATVAGVGVSGLVYFGVIKKISAFKNVAAWNPFDNFGKAKLIRKFNAIKEQNNSLSNDVSKNFVNELLNSTQSNDNLNSVSEVSVDAAQVCSSQNDTKSKTEKKSLYDLSVERSKACEQSKACTDASL